MADLTDLQRMAAEGEWQDLPPSTNKDPYDPRAHGLNGEILDAMLKAAYTEGVLAERKVQQKAGEEVARRSYLDGHKDGEAKAHGPATQEHRRRVHEALRLPLSMVPTLFRELEDTKRLTTKRRHEIAGDLKVIDEKTREAAFEV